MESTRIDRFNVASKICKDVYKELRKIVLDGKEKDIYKLYNLGNTFLINKLNNVYKNVVKKGILTPLNISLNNCVSGYIYEKGNDDYNYIKNGDVVKIEMGVYILDALVIWGDTFINSKEENDNFKYVELLKELSYGVSKEMKIGNINDDVSMYIASKCSENNCTPVENCISYQQLDGMISTDESKYIILNYQKYYDEEDKLVLENDCYEFEDDEVYNINLTIVKGEKSEWKIRHNSHIYRFNNYFYNLRLKSSREFLSKCKGKNGNNGFYINEWNNDAKYKLGIKECSDSGILDDHPIMYESDLVFSKKFTVMVNKKKGIIFG